MFRAPEGPQTFLDAYLSGDKGPEDIDRFVDAWHENPCGREIYDHLGMTRDEYAVWARNPDSLPIIAKARRASALQFKRGAAE